MRYVKKTIEYGLYLLVFLLPVQTRWIIRAGELNGGFWEYGTLSLYGTDILLMAILVMFFFYNFKKKKLEIRNLEFGDENKTDQVTSYKLQISRVWWLIAGLELTVFISLFVAADKIIAIYAYLKFLSGVGLFWLVISAPYKRARLIYSFLAGAAFQAGLGIYQFLSQSAFALKWLGLAAHNPSDLGTSVVETAVGIRTLRAYGGLDHPNVLGGMLVVGILLAIGLIIQNYPSNTNRVSHNAYHVSRKNILLCVMCYALCVALFFTFSRGAWLGLLVAIAGLLAFLIIKKDMLKQKRLLYLILAASIGFYVLFNLYADLAMTRLAGEARLEAKSNTERIESFQVARDLIADNFFIGTGIGNYTNTVERDIVGGRPAWYYQPVHNFFLLVLAEIGVFGFIFMLWLIWQLLQKSFKKAEYINFSILLALIIMMIFDHWFWSLHFGVLLYWLVLGLVFSQKEDKLL